MSVISELKQDLRDIGLIKAEETETEEKEPEKEESEDKEETKEEE